MAVTDLTQDSDRRYHVVNIKDALVEQPVMADTCRILDIDLHACKVDIASGIIIGRRLETAMRTISLADVIVPTIFIFQSPVTLRTDLQIIDQIDAVRHVGIHFFDAEINPWIFRRDAAADQIVRIEDQFGFLWNVLCQNIADIFRDARCA